VQEWPAVQGVTFEGPIGGRCRLSSEWGGGAVGTWSLRATWSHELAFLKDRDVLC
jgi:hypothetical protein